MLFFKTIHIISVITWFAGLFYLPRLFVYHAMSSDNISMERFKIMERKLYNGIMTPSAVITILSGFYLLTYFGYEALWIKLKITLVSILFFYHIICYKYLKLFKKNKNKNSHIYYRWFNEFPVIILIGIIILVVYKPL
jgi:putative membrane protein